MSEPTPISVPPELAALVDDYPDLIPGLRDARLAGETPSPLTEREIELIRLGVMMAIDAPQASFDGHVRRALGASGTREDVIAVAAAIATIVGVPRILSTLPRLVAALDSEE